MAKDLEGVIIDELAQEMQQAQDFYLICEIMKDVGYSLIEINFNINEELLIKEWVENNCVGDHLNFRGKWLFEDPKEATMFRLRWL